MFIPWIIVKKVFHINPGSLQHTNVNYLADNITAVNISTFSESRPKEGFDFYQDNCLWVNRNSYDWIYSVPILVILGINAIFLVIIMSVSETYQYHVYDCACQTSSDKSLFIHRNKTKLLPLVMVWVGAAYNEYNCTWRTDALQPWLETETVNNISNYHFDILTRDMAHITAEPKIILI